MGHWNECNIEATTKVRDHVSVKELVLNAMTTDEVFYREDVTEIGALRKYKCHVTFEQEGQKSLESLIAVNVALRKHCMEHSLVINNLWIW